MAGIKYTEEQIKELLKNKYVRECSSKYITYTDEFKIRWLDLNKKWIHHKKIFKDFWFPDFIINSEIPKDTFDRLRYQLKNKWILGIINSKKWKPKKEKIDFSKMSLEQKIEYLEVENAYLKELYRLKHWKYP